MHASLLVTLFAFSQVVVSRSLWPHSRNETGHISKRWIRWRDDDTPGRRRVNGWTVDWPENTFDWGAKYPPEMLDRSKWTVWKEALLKGEKDAFRLWYDMSPLAPRTRLELVRHLRWEEGMEGIIDDDLMRVIERHFKRRDPTGLLDPFKDVASLRDPWEDWRRAERKAARLGPGHPAQIQAEKLLQRAQLMDPKGLLDRFTPNPQIEYLDPPPDWHNPWTQESPEEILRDFESVDSPESSSYIDEKPEPEGSKLRRWLRRLKEWLRRTFLGDRGKPIGAPIDPYSMPTPLKLDGPVPMETLGPDPIPPKPDPAAKPPPPPPDPKPIEPPPPPPPKLEPKPKSAPIKPKPLPVEPIPGFPRFPGDPAARIPASGHAELASRFNRLKNGESAMRVFPQLAGMSPELQAKTLFSVGLPEELTGNLARKIPAQVIKSVVRNVGRNLAVSLWDFFATALLAPLDAVLTGVDIVATIFMIIDLFSYELGTCDAERGVCLLDRDKHQEHRCHGHHPCHVTGDQCGHRSPEPHRTVCNWHQRMLYQTITGHGPWKEVNDEIRGHASADGGEHWKDKKGCDYMSEKKKQGCNDMYNDENNDCHLNWDARERGLQKRKHRENRACEYHAQATVERCKQLVDDWMPQCLATRKILIVMLAASADPSNTINPPGKDETGPPPPSDVTAKPEIPEAKVAVDPFAHLTGLPSLVGAPYSHHECHKEMDRLKNELCWPIKPHHANAACDRDVTAWKERCNWHRKEGV
ncbi:SAC3 family protein 1 [Sphaceloma murrayae]|uniref:SAC3 family protein 1 n=1 Tax=Sphaceloma murrayae TaxID=2082308 RepID=A0A2K1QL75_9PEZI|nr:SAC3 family protein 1 [Sphaceloma murrayae]